MPVAPPSPAGGRLLLTIRRLLSHVGGNPCPHPPDARRPRLAGLSSSELPAGQASPVRGSRTLLPPAQPAAWSRAPREPAGSGGSEGPRSRRRIVYWAILAGRSATIWTPPGESTDRGRPDTTPYGDRIRTALPRLEGRGDRPSGAFMSRPYTWSREQLAKKAATTWSGRGLSAGVDVRPPVRPRGRVPTAAAAGRFRSIPGRRADGAARRFASGCPDPGADRAASG